MAPILAADANSPSCSLDSNTMVIIGGGQIVTDADTRHLLADTELLDQHRLKIPFGYELR